MTTDIKPWEAVPAAGPLLRTKDAAEYLGCSKAHLLSLIQKGFLPEPVRLDPTCRTIGIPKPWLDAVINHRAATSGIAA